MNIENFFKNIKSRLGSPFNRIEISDEQYTIQLDDALELYLEYASEGTKPQIIILSAVSSQKEYTLPTNVYSVTEAFQSQSQISEPYFGKIVKEQLLYDGAFIQTMDYALFTSYIRDANELTKNHFEFHFSRLTHKLTFLTDIDTGPVALKVFQNEATSDLESLLEDRWLQKYTACLLKMQWSQNWQKYDKELVGGGKVNYERWYELASADKEKLEEELHLKKSEPIDFNMA